MTDFEEIKTRITIEAILADCGYQPKRNRMPCPIHNGQNPTSFSFSDHVYYCHSCEASGGLLDLVEVLLDINREEALKYLFDLAGTQLKCSQFPKKSISRIPKRKQQRDSLDAILYDLQVNKQTLETLRKHYTQRLQDARKQLRNEKLELSDYYSITQYAEYVLEELDTEVIRTIYEINVERKRLRNFRKFQIRE